MSLTPKLTQEQKQAVLMPYVKSTALWSQMQRNSSGLYRYGLPCICKPSEIINMIDVPGWEPRPHLIPLSKISDQVAIHLIHIQSPIYLNIRIYDNHRFGKQHGFVFEFQYESSKRRRTQEIGWKSLTPLQSQFLTAIAYDMPAFIDIGHPLNGKTLIGIGSRKRLDYYKAALILSNYERTSSNNPCRSCR